MDYNYNNSKYILFLLFLSPQLILTAQSDFIKSTKLPNNNFFIIKSDGLYNYNQDLSANNIIYSFPLNNQINSADDKINTIISEIEHENNLYLISLAKKNIYIYDYMNNNIYDSPYYLNELNTNSNYIQTGVNYKLIPYKFNSNNLEFIIVLMMVGGIKGNSILFLYYEIDINNKKVKFVTEKEFKDHSLDLVIIKGSNLSPYNISCHISSKSQDEIKCFYRLDYDKEFRSMKYLINNSPNEDNIVKINQITDGIIKIKSSISKDKNVILACYLDIYHSSRCYLNNQNFSSYQEIKYTVLSNCVDMETYYFEETKEFVFLCRKNTNTFFIQRYSYKNEQLIYLNSFKLILDSSCDKIKEYSLFYNNTNKDYNLLTDYNFIADNNNCQINKTENEIFYIDVNDTQEDSGNNGSEEEVVASHIIQNTFFNIVINKEQVEKLLDDIDKSDLNQDIKGYIEDIKNLFNRTDEDLKFKYGNKTITVKSTDKPQSKNETHVDDHKCVEKLKKYYNIKKLDRKQIEIDLNNPKSLHNQVEYAYYNEKNERLDASICNNEIITVYHKINKNSDFDLDKGKKFEEMGIDILDTQDSFFNDICYPYSESGNDLILVDRRSDIYQNFSLCDEGCTYNSIDYENLLIACDCFLNFLKENITTEIKPIKYEDFEDVSLMDSNIGVIKCYQLVFSLNDKSKNIGFWIFTILLIAYIVSVSFYFYSGIKPTMNYVHQEMVKYGYLTKKSPMFFEKRSNLQKTHKRSKKKSKTHKITQISNPIRKKLKLNKIENMNNNININYLEAKSRENKRKNSNKKKHNSSSALDAIINRNNNINLGNSGLNKSSHTKENTQTKENKNKKDDDDENLYFGIIKKNVKNINKHLPQESNQTLHNYTFNDAIKNDRRSFFRIYYIYLLSKQLIFHTFFLKSPLELFPLRICLFIFMISTDLALNGLFYLNDNISKKYRYAKSFFLFAFSDNITIIIYSTLLCFVLMSLLTKLSNSSNALRNVFAKQEEKFHKNKKYKISKKEKLEIFLEVQKVLKKLKVKIIILIIIQIILMLFYWYFITAFCHVYKSTQESWLWDSLLSIISRTIIELLFAMLFSKIYTIAVQSNIYTIYRIVIFIYDFS